MELIHGTDWLPKILAVTVVFRDLCIMFHKLINFAVYIPRIVRWKSFQHTVNIQ